MPATAFGMASESLGSDPGRILPMYREHRIAPRGTWSKSLQNRKAQSFAILNCDSYSRPEPECVPRAHAQNFNRSNFSRALEVSERRISHAGRIMDPYFGFGSHLPLTLIEGPAQSCVICHYVTGGRAAKNHFRICPTTIAKGMTMTANFEIRKAKRPAHHRRLTIILSPAVGFILATALAGPSLSQTDHVSSAAHARLMQSAATAIQNYRSAGSNKALAACIDWTRSNADRISWRAVGQGSDKSSVASARSTALQSCERSVTQRNLTCTCQIVDVNGRPAN